MICIRCVLRPIVVSGRALPLLVLGAVACLSLVTADLPAQRSRQSTDSVPLRADYRGIGELLAKLPKVAPPTFEERDGVELGAIQLSCLDRLQPLHPPRGQERGEAADSSTRSAADSLADSACATPPPFGEGQDYFWVASYSLVPRNNQTRAFWGCSDWHSAVRSTWATVYLLKRFPRSTLQELPREKLAGHLGASNLVGELEFFEAAAGRSRQRESDDGAGLRASARRAASRDTGYNDLTKAGPAPSPRRRMGPGEVVSPCLTEAALMSAVLGQNEFVKWLDGFIPPPQSGRFAALTEPAGGNGPVAARDSAQMSGLSFSGHRPWSGSRLHCPRTTREWPPSIASRQSTPVVGSS